MDMKYIRVSGYLNLHTVNLYKFVSVLNVFLIDKVIGIARVHYDNNPVLNTLLTDGEHYFIELFLIRPLLRFITDESGNTLDGFQFRRLIP